jgi:hypothetical protein
MVTHIGRQHPLIRLEIEFEDLQRSLMGRVVVQVG